MSIHSFDTEIAAEVGVVAATIFQHLRFWIEKNAANERSSHFHEGRWWTYNSTQAFARLFPYLTEKQIRTALDKLVEVGLIGVGNFNGSAYDRTRWFCLIRQVHLPVWANGSAQKGEPIPDSKPDIKPDLFGSIEPHSSSGDDAPASMQNTEKKEPTKKEQTDGWFESFWSHYPKKVEKAGARAKFEAAVRKGVDPERIISAAATYAKSEQVARGFVKHPTTWLNQGCWDDEVPAVHQPGDALDMGPAAQVRRKMAAAEDSRKALSWVCAGELAVEAEKLAVAHGVPIDRVAVQRFKLLARSEIARQKGERDRAFSLEQEAMALGGGA